MAVQTNVLLHLLLEFVDLLGMFSLFMKIVEDIHAPKYQGLISLRPFL